MRRLIIFLVASLLGSCGLNPCYAEMPVKYRVSLSETGAGLNRGLTFHAPFDDPSNPLKIYKGTGAFTLTRATSAWYTHPTTGFITEAADNVLRIESNGALIEGARTNVLTYSEQFNNVAWTAGVANLTITPNAAVAPDGNATADLVSVDNGISGGSAYFNRTTTLTAPYTIIVYAKAAGYTAFSVNNGSGDGGNYDVSAETAAAIGGAHVSASITPLGNGWYKCTTSVGVGGLANPHFYTPFGAGTGDGIKGLYFWGAQMESGAFPSFYTPAVAAAVTRNADVLSLPSSGNIDNVAGTLAMEWVPEFASTMTTGAAYYLFDAGDLEAYYNATDQKIYFKGGDNTVSTAALTFSANVTQKLAFRWGTSGLDIYRDGASVATGADYVGPTLGGNLYIGSDTAGANQAFSNIESERIWNRALSDAELQSITR